MIRSNVESKLSQISVFRHFSFRYRRYKINFSRLSIFRNRCLKSRLFHFDVFLSVSITFFRDIIFMKKQRKVAESQPTTFWKFPQKSHWIFHKASHANQSNRKFSKRFYVRMHISFLLERNWKLMWSAC